jgi:hypothetical protein
MGKYIITLNKSSVVSNQVACPQNVLCSADGTMERQGRTIDGGFKPFIDGSQEIRACGDHRELIRYMRSVGKNVTLEPIF